jgi:phosphopantothenoylcysteine decarboxylase/phosphopantothenate--cysteine ligase
MKILIGISAGISIYKIPAVIRMLRRDGHTVRVIMTRNAVKLVSPLLFKAISGEEVFVDDFDIREPLAHIRLSDWADVFAVAPASADILAKIASGFADSLLTTSMLAFNKKKILFPAMNTRMFDNRATQENLHRLSLLGYEVIMPDSGDLACGTSGRGRLPPEDKISSYIGRDMDAPLKGMKFLVTAGGTVEKIDPVRFISNFSSGRMGIEIARALFKKGSEVLLVYSGITSPLPAWIPSIKALSAGEMLDAVMSNMASFDGLYMAGAPADFKPAVYSEGKIKKDRAPVIELVKTPDILKEISISGLGKGKLTVGFALESENGKENALKKLKEKALDFIVLNMIDAKNNIQPMGSDNNNVTLFSGESGECGAMEGSKKDIAGWLVLKTACHIKKAPK